MAKEANDKAEKEIEKLLRDDHIQRKIITKIVDVTEEWLIAAPTPQKALAIDGMLEELAEAKTEVNGICRDIIHLCVDLTDATKAKKIEDERFTQNDITNQACWEAKGKLLDIKRRVLEPEGGNRSRMSIASSTMISNVLPGATAARVKLPDIPIPKFDGNPRNFLDFRNLFESVIHNDESLSPIQKFYFLRGALVGAAESFLKGVNIAGDQYEKTWKDFCSEFGKKRLVVGALLSDLFNVSPIKHESGVRELMNTFEVAVRGLKQCGEQTDSWSVLLSYLLSSKLDFKTRNDFENSLTTNDNYPPYKKLRDFLNIRAANSSKRDIEKSTPERKPSDKKSSNSILTIKPRCIVCQADHLLIDCTEFDKKTLAERYQIVNNAKRCTNCFNRNHQARDCRRSGCAICGAKHHQLLHSDGAESLTRKFGVAEQSKSVNNIVNNSIRCQQETVVLPTAVVKLQCGDFSGSARILIDSASEISMISSDFVSSNKLKKSPSSRSTSIQMVHAVMNATHECQLEMSSRFGSFSLTIKAEVVPEKAFGYNINRLRMGAVCNKLKLLTLADPAFTKPIVDFPVVNIIVGAEYYLKIIDHNQKTKVVDGVELLLSNFGWVIMGKVCPSD